MTGFKKFNGQRGPRPLPKSFQNPQLTTLALRQCVKISKEDEVRGLDLLKQDFAGRRAPGLLKFALKILSVTTQIRRLVSQKQLRMLLQLLVEFLPDAYPRCRAQSSQVFHFRTLISNGKAALMSPMKTTKIWILTAMVATLLALGTHGYLTAQNYRLKSGLAEGKSICNISSQFNCDAVALSKYAEVGGIPVAVWGIATNAVFLFFLIVLFTRISVDTARVARFSFYFSLLILGASVVMGFISSTQLGTYCLFCLAAYGLSVVQTLAVFFVNRAENPTGAFRLDLAGAFREQRWLLILIIIVPGLAWLGHRMGRDAFGRGIPPHLIAETIAFWKSSPPQEFNPTEGLRLTVGDPEKARMTIVEFADFLCPHCKMAAPPLHVFTESRRDVLLVFKPFPLDGTCNPGITHRGDGFRCRLAAAALCAEKIAQKGWAAHDWIFERQSELSSGRWDEDMAQLANATGIEKENLKSCVESPETQDLLKRLSEEGTKAKIQGTPTIFVNGRKLDAGQFIQVLDGAYDAL